MLYLEKEIIMHFLGTFMLFYINMETFSISMSFKKDYILTINTDKNKNKNEKKT